MTTASAPIDMTLSARPTGDAALEPDDEEAVEEEADEAVDPDDTSDGAVVGAMACDADDAVDAPEDGTVTVSDALVSFPLVDEAVTGVVVLVEPAVALPEAEGQRGGT